MTKKIILLISFLFCFLHSNAQEKHNIKLGIEAGILPLSKNSENLELFFNFEPKIKILENTFIGLRLGLTLNSHVFEMNDVFQFNIDEKHDNAILSFVPTVDHYWHINNFRPYLGLGLGYHLLPDPIDIIAFPSREILDGRSQKRVGVLLRGGLELKKLRLGLEYNFLPKADIKIPDGQTIGTVANSYWGLSIGFIFGVGKSSQSSSE